VAADHIVTIFVFADVSGTHTAPEYKRLAAYARLTGVLPGKARPLELTFPAAALTALAEEAHLEVLAPGSRFWVGVGPHVDCRDADARTKSGPTLTLEDDIAATRDATWDPSNCQALEIPEASYALPACTYACQQWDHSHGPKIPNPSCDRNDAAQHLDFEACMAHCEGAATPWGWDYVRCLERARTDGVCSPAARCWDATGAGAAGGGGENDDAYKIAMWAMFALNFVFAVLLLISTRTKPKSKTLNAKGGERAADALCDEDLRGLLNETKEADTAEDAAMDSPSSSELEVELRRRHRDAAVV